MPAALSRSTAAGGVLVMNVNVRSEKTVMTTGMMRPWSFAVRALNVLQNSMMFTPCWPSAGPTGGAGVACPPVTCSRTCAVTCRAMALPFLLLLHLPVFQLPRYPPPEDRQLHAHVADGLEDLLDLPLHALEGAVHHLDPVAHVELGPAPD